MTKIIIPPSIHLKSADGSTDNDPAEQALAALTIRARGGRLVLQRCRNKKTQEIEPLVCAMVPAPDGTKFGLVPLASLITGDVSELYEPPEGVESVAQVDYRAQLEVSRQKALDDKRAIAKNADRLARMARFRDLRNALEKRKDRITDPDHPDLPAILTSLAQLEVQEKEAITQEEAPDPVPEESPSSSEEEGPAKLDS